MPPAPTRAEMVAARPAMRSTAALLLAVMHLLRLPAHQTTRNLSAKKNGQSLQCRMQLGQRGGQPCGPAHRHRCKCPRCLSEGLHSGLAALPAKAVATTAAAEVAATVAVVSVLREAGSLSMLVLMTTKTCDAHHYQYSYF